MNSPIYKDYFYTTTAATFEYYIVADSQIVFSGKAWRNPDTNLTKVNVGRIIRDYLRFDLPDYRPLDDVVTKQEDAYKVFTLYSAAGTQLEQYNVLFDWTGEWNGETKVLSNPINGVLDPRMKILWSVYGPNSFDVDMENWPITIDSYFRLLTQYINADINGGSHYVRWRTDYLPSSEWTVDIPGVTGYTYTGATRSGITVNLPSNPELNTLKEYDIYYHIHGLTFGPTHVKQTGGEFHITTSEVTVGSFSGDTANVDWSTNYTGATITYSGSSWIELTDITNSGATINAMIDNNALSARTGEVIIYLNGEEVGSFTVNQEPKYFNLLTTGITFNFSGGTDNIHWDTDIPSQYLSVVVDHTGFTFSNITQSGCVITAAMNEEDDSLYEYANVYLNGSVLLGSVLLQQAGVDWETRYLTIQVLEDGKIVAVYAGGSIETRVPYYRKRGGGWDNAWHSSGTSVNKNYYINVVSGDVYEFKWDAATQHIGISRRLRAESKCNVKGNIMSLAYGDNFYGKKGLEDVYMTGHRIFDSMFYNSKYVNAKDLVLPCTALSEYHEYGSMFSNNPELVTAPKILPAKVLTAHSGNTGYHYSGMFKNCPKLQRPPVIMAENYDLGCFDSMFEGCTSLIEAPSLPSADTISEYSCANMFKGCTSLTAAPDLPATTLSYYSYAGMFEGCTSLTAPPDLPTTTLGYGSYQAMFKGCTSLTAAPDLPATTLTIQCYDSMFEGCTSLESAPVIHADSLPESACHRMFKGCNRIKSAEIYVNTMTAMECAAGMFSGCTMLSSVTCTATQVWSSNMNDWLANVSWVGVFKKNPQMNDWTRGSNGIPTDWSVIDYIE